MRSNLWSLVLAAGAGRRLASLTGGVPKQFWSGGTGPTLLDSTLDRTAMVAPARRTVIVVDRSHRKFVEGPAALARRARVVHQHSDRGTAAGVLLGLTEVLAAERDALIMLTPSDHGVARPALFAEEVSRAADQVRTRKCSIALFGAQPDRPDPDYGWIVPAGGAQPSRTRLHAVAGFFEKPSAEVARQLFAAGGIWNTMVLVGRASAIFELYRRHLPLLASLFARAIDVRDRQARHAMLDQVYAELPTADFSRHLLEATTGLMVRAWPLAMGWSDLGTPERLARWHAAHATPLVRARHAAYMSVLAS